MWSLFPHLVNIGKSSSLTAVTNVCLVVGDNSDDGGYAFDYLTSMEDYMKNIMRIGNQGMLTKKIGDAPLISFFIKGIIKILQIARNETGGVNNYV